MAVVNGPLPECYILSANDGLRYFSFFGEDEEGWCKGPLTGVGLRIRFMRLQSADRVDPKAEVLADFVDETAGRTAAFD